MISEFRNQLTQIEIFKGLLIYINRKLCYSILLFMIVVGVFAYISRDSLMDGLLGALVIAIVSEIFLTLVYMRQFSTKKIAIYKLHDDFLEIIGSNGISQTYNYSQVQSIGAKDIIVLFLSKSSFAVVAKRHLNTKQIRILQM